MDTVQWPQEIVVKPIEDIVVTNTCPKPAASVERKPRPQKEQALNCPRCHSTNTKFCYYNNYSLTQPRYFCKTCRRYWTEGGSLRSIPVGGGSRKNKRSSASTCSSSISSSSPSPKNLKLIPDLVTPSISLSQNCTQNNPKVHHEGQDLNLAFPATTRDYRNNISELVQQNNNNNNNNSNVSASASCPSSTITTSAATTTSTTTPSTTSHHLSALELLTGITSTSRGLNSFMPHVPVHPPPDPNNVYTCGGFPLQDFKPSLNFSLDGIGSGFATSLQGVHQETGGGGGRLLFPFEDLKQVSSTTTATTTTMDQNNSNKEQQGDSTVYWTGILGGGSW